MAHINQKFRLCPVPLKISYLIGMKNLVIYKALNLDIYWLK